MKKEFKYISDCSYLFFILMLLLMPVGLISFALVVTAECAWVGGLLFLLWLILLILCFIFQYLNATFQADDKEFEFQFRKKQLHFRYDEISECQLMYYPEHSRFGGLVGYKIHLHITDREKNEHVIRQYVQADYSFLDYPQGLPEEAQNAELTEIGNFIKSRISPEKKAPVKPETDHSAEIQEILNAMQGKIYLKNAEIQQTYDFIEEYYKKNLILTLTADKTFCEQDEIRIRFENISCLEMNLNSMTAVSFSISDHMRDSYEPQNRYELTEEENDTLFCYFEKAEISS